MGVEDILANFLNPVILFFFLGMLAVLLKSDLEIPQPLPKLFTLYLLFAIGFKGGAELHASGFDLKIITILLAAIALAIFIPFYTFFILKKKLSVYDAGAIAATYGSVSAVTFITANTYLQNQGIMPGGHMVAALALMESPAIIVGILLTRFYAKQSKKKLVIKKILHEAFVNGSVFLLLGSLFIGLLSGEQGKLAFKPFTDDIFKGMLAFFLLDIGIITAKKIKDFKSGGLFLTAFALIVPIINAGIAMLIAWFLQMDIGSAFLLTVLSASASYLAVPAAMRMALPEANPGLYVSMSLGITFPFNVVFGIPLYFSIISTVWR